jgi:hypothetical protein
VDGEYRAQVTVARESTRTAAGINQLGVKAATFGAFVAVFGVFTAAIVTDENASQPFAVAAPTHSPHRHRFLTTPSRLHHAALLTRLTFGVLNRA